MRINAHQLNYAVGFNSIYSAANRARTSSRYFSGTSSIGVPVRTLAHHALMRISSSFDHAILLTTNQIAQFQHRVGKLVRCRFVGAQTARNNL